MRTAAEMLDRMEALCRKLAAADTWWDGGYGMRDEARAIVAELPDPDRLEAEQIGKIWADQTNRWGGANEVCIDLILLGIKRGRELAAK